MPAAPDLAYVASAGAVALALSTTFWAWRLKTGVDRRQRALEERLRTAEAQIADGEAAEAAFDAAVIAVEGEEVRLVSGADALAEVARGLKVETDVFAVLKALAETGGARGEALKALIESGQPFRFDAPAEGGTVLVEGRPLGALAMIRVSLSADGARVAPGRFADLADRWPAPAWICDRDGALVWANRAWLHAVEAADLDDARERNLTLDPGAEALAIEAARLGQTREGFRWITVDAQRHAFRIVAEPVGEGEAAAYALDVTESEENREALRRHVSAHDETLNHLADAVAIFGAEKRLTFHNTAFETLWGLDAGWLAERPTHGEILDRLRQRRRLPETADYSKFKAGELDFYGSTEVAPDALWSLPDGRTLRVVRQPHPLGGLLLLFSDITDELKLKAQYNAQIQVQKATLDKLNDAVAVFGSDGRLRLHNEAFERLWNLGAAALEEAGDFDGVERLCLTVVHDRVLWRELKARVADPDPQARVPISGEANAADGRVLAYLSRPLPDGATLIAFSDVTATKTLERALSERSAALVEAERLKREFVGNVSYELRTPLTTILGYAELLEAQGQSLSDRARAYVGSVRSAATQLARSIDDVLDMAQIDAGEMGLALGPVRVCEVLAEAAERVRRAVEERGGELVVRCPDDAGAILADPQRIAQAVDQLTAAAARAIPPGGTVTVAAERGQGEVRVSVSDTGRGIPFHQQAHVFDRFVGRDRGGPGLGLALVKALVELHGGWVALESEPGKGSTFTLHLPEAADTDAVIQRELAV
jgi:signal transduction histidine kinase